jgi:hypothetical protein
MDAWEVFGIVVLTFAAGLYLGARAVDWYLRNRYWFTPRWPARDLDLTDIVRHNEGA